MTSLLKIPDLVESIAALSETERSQLFAQLSALQLISFPPTPQSGDDSASENAQIAPQVEPEQRDLTADPLVGLFAADPELATESEAILAQEITPQSGWTWKPAQR